MATKTFVLGEFRDVDSVLAAARTLREANVGTLDAYSPYPIHGMEEALGLPRSRVPLMALVCGVSGAGGGYFFQWWCNAWDYPLNVGNRAIAGWPTNIPITFESGILMTALALFFGTLAFFFKLPRPYHPVFESEAVRSASLDAVWISVEQEEVVVAASAPVRQPLRVMGARRVETVRGPTE
ncbi:MAG: DUF3341 domain-containing protein [Steroidobacteraceae bacterium]